MKIPNQFASASRPLYPAAPEFSEQQWKKLELALAGDNLQKVVKTIPLRARDEIYGACGRYFRFYVSCEAHRRRYLRLLRAAGAVATKLIKFIDEYCDEEEVGDLKMNVSGRNVDVSLNNMRIRLEDVLGGDYGLFTSWISTDRDELVARDHAVRKEIESLNARKLNTGEADQVLIAELSDILRQSGFRVSARKDVDKWTKDSPSPFVRFFGALQGLFPSKFRGKVGVRTKLEFPHQALSVQVARALEKWRNNKPHRVIMPNEIGLELPFSDASGQ